MRNAARDAEIAEVDAMLAAPKKLAADLPIWNLTQRQTSYDATWGVLDQHGATLAQLRFNCLRSADPRPTINLVWRSRPIWRIELDTRPHRNPSWTLTLNLRPIVAAFHEHSWLDNREHVRVIAPGWDIPAKRELVPPPAGLPQALAAFASTINLTIDSTQRAFDVPAQGEMFP